MRCSFCYELEKLRGDTTNELDAGEIVNAILALKSQLAPNPSLTVLGGEPLLQKEKLLAIAGGGAKLGISTIVSTNGLLVDEDFARKAKEMQMQVQVSIHGATAGSHEEIRGKGTFEKAVAAAQLLAARGVDTSINMVCHRGNMDELRSYFDMAAKIGVRVRFIPLKAIGGAMATGLEPVPLPELLLMAAKILEQHPDYLELMGTDALSITAGTCALSMKRKSCGTGSKTLLIDADGRLYPCLNAKADEFCFGNLREGGFDLQKTWNSSERLMELRRKSDVDSAESPCAACPVRYWCVSGCRGETWHQTGRWPGRAVNCTEQRKAIIEVFWLLAKQPELAQNIRSYC